MKKAIALLAALLLGLTGCGQSAADKAASSTAPEPGVAAGFPAKVQICDQQVTFEKAPERVVMMSGTAAPILYKLGVLDSVIAHAGKKDFGPTATDLQAKVAAIEPLASNEGQTGGAQISVEAVLALNPDLVVGFGTGVDRDALAEAGIPLFVPDALCENYSVTHADWKLVDGEFTKLATIFGVQDKLPAILDELHKQVKDLEGVKVGKDATASALYITPGSTEFYAYGTSSMVQPIFEAVGLTNSYADQTTRVFDASMEDLLKRNPEWIVLLPQAAETQATIDTFLGFNGAKDLQAVRNDQVIVIPFALTDPPSNLSVDGATELSKAIAAK